MPAQFRIDQINPGAGVAGRSRHDLVVNEIITLTATDPAPGVGITFSWEILDKRGSSATLSSPTGQVVTIGPDSAITAPCAFLVELTATTPSGITKTRRICSVRSAAAGLRVPVFPETAPDAQKLGLNTPDLSTDNALYANRSGTGVSEQNWGGWSEWAWEVVMAIESGGGGGGGGSLQDSYDLGSSIAINITPVHVSKATDGTLLELVNDTAAAAAPLLTLESKSGSRTGALARALQYGTAPILETADVTGIGLNLWRDGLRGRVALTVQPDVPSAAGSSGYPLVLKGGNASAGGGGGQKGANAQLFGGDGVATGGDPGGAFVDSGAQGGAATKGKVFIGALSAERIDLGSTVNGIPVRFHESAADPGSSPIADTVQVFGLHDNVTPDNPGIEGTQLFARDALGKLWRITGGVAAEIDNTLSPYALKVTDVGVEVSAAAGAVTITLPTGLQALGFKPMVIYIRAGQAHAVTLARGGGSDAINGVTADYVIGATAGAVSPVAVLISYALSTWVVQQLDANPEAVEVISGATYTVAPGDHKKTYLCTNAGGCTVTVPASGVELGHETTFIGAPGVVTFVSGGGGGTNSVAQLPASLSLVTAEAYSVASIKVTGIGVGVGTYTLAGDLLPNTPDPVTDGDFTLNGDLVRTGAGTYSATLYNHAATTAPGAGDDSADGYSVGSRWIDVTNKNVYMCVDATIAAAVWERLDRVTDAEYDRLLGESKSYIQLWRDEFGYDIDQWGTELSGAGSSVGLVTTLLRASGWVYLNPGTTAAGIAALRTHVNFIYATGLAFVRQIVVGQIVEALPNGVDDYYVQVCLLGNTTNGLGFIYDSTVSANWQGVKWVSSTPAYVDTGIAAVSATDIRMTLDWTPGVGGGAVFWINGAQVGSFSGSMPALSAVYAQPGRIVKTLGTGTRRFGIDFTEGWALLSTPRV